jgi:hypothetical protein
MKIRDVPQSGKRGQVIASRNRFGQYVCEHVERHQPGTKAQLETWDNMTVLSRLWNEIEEAQREAWRGRAVDVHSRPSLGQYGRLDGRHLFLKINRTLATCARDPLLDPPAAPEFGPNPVKGFEIRQVKGDLVLALKVDPQAGGSRPAEEDLMVFAWAPCNAGVARNSLYVFLGLLPEPVAGESIITDLYLSKLKTWRRLADPRYHVRLEGSRIFVRVWQQINGWEHERAMFRGSAFVPRQLPAGAGQNR